LLSILSIPKAFVRHNAIIQRNATRSWLELVPQCEIMLFGDDHGVVDAAKELGVAHIPFIEKNEYGTPLLSSVFTIAEKIAKYDILMYVNADIILFQDLIEAVRQIDKPLFLMCGRRRDLDVKHEIDFNDPVWADALQEKVIAEGKLHSLSGIDYFIFKRHSVDMPPFAVGRPGWDGWLIYEMRRKGIPVIDATEAITVIHQNHDYSHSQFGEKKRVGGPEWPENIRTAGGLTNMLTLRDADWVLTKKGMKRPAFHRRLYSMLSLCYPWRMLLAAKRKVQNPLNR
jgi:hypothetical protein